MIHRFFGRAVRRLLGGKRSSLARAFKAHGTRARPRNDITLIIRNRHNGVIECRMNVHYPFGDIFPATPFARGLLFPLPLSLLLLFFRFVRFCHNALLKSVNLWTVPVSCLPPSCAALCACARLYAYADLERVNFYGAADPGKSSCRDVF